MNNKIKRPEHYVKSNGVETIDGIKIITDGLNGVEAFCVGNIVKYVSRYKYKNGVEDLEKAKCYLDMLIKENNNEDVRTNN